MDFNRLFILLANFIAVIFVLCLHEFAHAFVAYRCGDPTAKWSGRMTLNPLKHFDVLGVLMFTFFGFGWAKPVPVNPNNFKKYKLGTFLTSGAGIFVNLLTAFLIYPLFSLFLAYLYPLIEGKYLGLFLLRLFQALYGYSLVFAAFNFIPLFPLDGFRIVTAFNKKQGKVYRFFLKYGRYILLALILVDILAGYFPVLEYVNALGFAMHWITWLFEQPIRLFWGLLLPF